MHDGIFDRQADGGAMEDIPRRAVRLFTAEECSASASELLAFRRWREKSGVSWQTAIVKADEEDDAFSKTRKVHSSFDGEVRRMLESEEKR